jgi:hypothetical protein
VARGVTAAQMVRALPDKRLLEPAAISLQERGANVITTTCGFLDPLQDAIAKRLRVPFVASSLLQIPEIYSVRHCCTSEDYWLGGKSDIIRRRMLI